MKRLFKYIFTIFLASGTALVIILLCAAMNDLYLRFFQPLFITPEVAYTIVLQIFKTIGIVTVCTFPTVLVNVITRGYSERTTVKEGNEIVIAGMILFTLFIIFPMILFLVKQTLQPAMVLSVLFASGIIFGGGGNKYPLPSWWK